MKVFIDPAEQFVIKIPEQWYFTTTQKKSDQLGQPYCFEPYESRNAAFQVSYKKITEKTIKLEIDKQPLGRSNLNFIIGQSEEAKTWVTNVESDHILIVSLAFESSVSTEQRQELISLGDRAVKTILVLDEASKNSLLPILRWENFMISYAASMDLANRAYENESFIELIVLLANQIDATLRQALILSKQLEEKSNNIDISLIYQSEADRPLMEKKIYSLALESRIVDQSVYDKLNRLYGIRNKVVHRYVISDLRSNDIIQLVIAYDQIFDHLSDYVNSLEKRQFDEKIGIYDTQTRPGSEGGFAYNRSLISRIRDKHGNRKLNENISVHFGKNVTSKN